VFYNGLKYKVKPDLPQQRRERLKNKDIERY